MHDYPLSTWQYIFCVVAFACNTRALWPLVLVIAQHQCDWYFLIALKSLSRDHFGVGNHLLHLHLPAVDTFRAMHRIAVEEMVKSKHFTGKETMNVLVGALLVL